MAIRGMHLGFDESEKGFDAHIKGNETSCSSKLRCVKHLTLVQDGMSCPQTKYVSVRWVSCWMPHRSRKGSLCYACNKRVSQMRQGTCRQEQKEKEYSRRGELIYLPGSGSRVQAPP